MVNVSTGRAPPGGYCRINGSILSMGCDMNGQIWWVGTNKVSLARSKLDSEISLC